MALPTQLQAAHSLGTGVWECAEAPGPVPGVVEADAGKALRTQLVLRGEPGPLPRKNGRRGQRRGGDWGYAAAETRRHERMPLHHDFLIHR